MSFSVMDYIINARTQQRKQLPGSGHRDKKSAVTKKILCLLPYISLFLVFSCIIFHMSAHQNSVPLYTSLLTPTYTFPISIPTASRPTRYPTTLFISPTPPMKVDRNCALTDYRAETASWSTYRNLSYSYSFRYPRDATTYFNKHSHAPQDYDDAIYIPVPSSTKIIPAFDLSIVTLKHSHETFNYYKTELSKVVQSGGEWRDHNEITRRITFLDEPGYISEYMYRDVDDPTTMSVHIKVFRNDVLFDFVLDEREQLVACQILSTFKFIR
jgi:hypothetical protein